MSSAIEVLDSLAQSANNKSFYSRIQEMEFRPCPEALLGRLFGWQQHQLADAIYKGVCRTTCRLSILSQLFNITGRTYSQSPIPENSASSCSWRTTSASCESPGKYEKTHCVRSSVAIEYRKHVRGWL